MVPYVVEPIEHRPEVIQHLRDMVKDLPTPTTPIIFAGDLEMTVEECLKLIELRNEWGNSMYRALEREYEVSQAGK